MSTCKLAPVMETRITTPAEPRVVRMVNSEVKSVDPMVMVSLSCFLYYEVYALCGCCDVYDYPIVDYAFHKTSGTVVG